MSPELRETILDKEGQRADRERARVEYLVDFIENNELALREAFIDETVPEADVPLAIYNKTTRALNAVEAKLLQSVGVTTSHRLVSNTGADNDPLIRLGWMRWVPYNPEGKDLSGDTKVTHVYLATEEGREVVDGLRAAQGYVDTREQWRINTENRGF